MTRQIRKRRKLFGGLLLLALLGFGLVGEGLAQRLVKAGAIRVVLPPGNVGRQQGPQLVRATAKKDMTLYYQDVLETGVGGRLRARLDDGSILALGSQSRLQVVEHDAQSQQSTLQLEYGKVRAQVVRLTRPGSRFEIRTNTAVAGVLGTDEVIDAFSPVATLVLSLDGIITVSNVDPTVPGAVVLNAGQVTIVQQGLAPTPARAATPQELQDALEGTTGAAPQPLVDLGTGFVTAGQEFVLNAADSFATGTITNYQWIITRAADNVTVYNQGQAGPVLQVDTTTWQPGNYNGTLTITTSTNQTGSVNFSFVVIPAAMANTSPEQVIQQLQLAYETLQPAEFMKLFDPAKYSGYAALQQSVEASFRNLSQARVFVRKASGQIFEQAKTAIYQVDFETQFSTKAEPNRVFVVREQATLRLESGSGWLIADVPQGKLGGAGLPGIPGVSDPSQANTAGSGVNTGAGAGVNVKVSGGERVLVPAGGFGESFTIQNTSGSNITLSFSLPSGITLTGGGASGTSFTVNSGQTLDLVFGAGAEQPAGTVTVSSTISSGGSSLPGPTIPVTVFRLSLNFPGGGSPANPVPVLLGFGGTATVQVSSTVATGHSVALSGSGGQVVTSFSPNPLPINPGNNSANANLTLAPVANAPPGTDQVTIQAAAGSTTISAPLFINRIVPFTMTRSPAELSLFVNQGASITFNVNFNAPFTGPVQITAPAGSGGVTFSPAAITVNNAGSAVFTATAGASALPSTNYAFTATAGTFSQTAAITLSVVQPVQCSLSVSPPALSLAPGQSGDVTAQVSFLGGVQVPVAVSLVSGGDASRFTVSGGGSVPNASGSVTFTVSVLPGVPPGSGSFTVSATDCSPAPEAQVSVTILGSFDLTGPAVISLLRNGSLPLSIGLVPQQGFNAPVALMASSNNPGITISGPSTLAPGQQAEFTVAASADAIGPGTITIQGVSGTVSRTLTITALVGSFTLTADVAQPIPLFLGTTGSFPVTVTPAAGFTGEVVLTAVATGGVTVGSVSPVTGGSGTRTFTLGASATATPGLAKVTITGTSGSLSSAVVVSVQLTEGFSLSADPATLFLGNPSPVVIRVQRQGNFQGGVTVQFGNLPEGITRVQPTSAVVPVGTSTVTFQVTADANLSRVGKSVLIPITGQAVTASLPQALGRPQIEGGARIVSANITGTFQAPFSISTPSGTDLGTVSLSQPTTALLGVSFSQGFAGLVQVQGVGTSGVSVLSGPAQLVASGTVSLVFSTSLPGSYTVEGVATAGTFELAASFTIQTLAPLPPPPAPVPEITSPLTASGTVGTAFSYQITATNSPTSFGATALPAGLSVNTATGAITGTPTTAGTSTVVLSATNSAGIGTAALTLMITSPVPVITSATTASGTVGTAFSYLITATNSPTSFNATGLPGGLAVNTATGAITGTPTTAGTSTVTLSATNSFGAGTANLVLTINLAAPVITSVLTASGTVGTAFSYLITATNSPTSFGATGLPAGLIVNTTTGAITGTPTTAGTSTVTLSATNSGGTGTATLTLTINLPAKFRLSVSPASPVQVNANIPVAMQVQVVLIDLTFNLPVTVTVPDGAQMQFDPVCGRPPGFVSYSGSPGVPGTLTFTISPPFSLPVSFCMSAGQLSGSTITAGSDAITITGTGTGSAPATVSYSFTIGVPALSIGPAPTSSFNISLSGTATANITLTATNGFNLPVTVHLTGSGSFISSTGPFLVPLPTGINSTDCGPSTAGKILSPPSSLTNTCQITNNTTSGSSTPIELELFGTFGPGAKIAVFFPICALGPGVTPGCGVGIVGEPRFSKAVNPVESSADAATQAPQARLAISPADIRVSPSMPKEGDRVLIRAQVENQGEADAEDVVVALVVDQQTVAVKTVSISAGSSERIEFEWEAAYDPLLSVALSIDPEGRLPQESIASRLIALRNFFVEPAGMAAPRQGRSLLVVANGQCAGFRLLTASQTSCGGSSDFELSPTITAEGQLLIQVLTLTGGILDLGSQPLTGVLAVPEFGYQPRAALESGHLYAIQSNGKYGLLYVARIQSDVDPRLARLTQRSESQPAVESLEDLRGSRLDQLLDRSRITLDFQWAYLEDGSRRFDYGFRPGGQAPRPYRQPRVSPPAVKE